MITNSIHIEDTISGIPYLAISGTYTYHNSGSATAQSELIFTNEYQFPNFTTLNNILLVNIDNMSWNHVTQDGLHYLPKDLNVSFKYAPYDRIWTADVAGVTPTGNIQKFTMYANIQYNANSLHVTLSKSYKLLDRDVAIYITTSGNVGITTYTIGYK